MLPTTPRGLLRVFREWAKSAAFRHWISDRRWFPLRREASLEVIDSLLLGSSRKSVSGIIFLRAGNEDFQLPLFLTQDKPAALDFAAFTAEGGEVFLQEGELSEGYCSNLFRLMAEGAELKTALGRPVSFRGPSLSMVSPPRPVTLGKSTNVSVLIESASGPVFLKSFRRVEKAAREPVLLKFLTSQGYKGAPTLLGSVTTRDNSYLAEALSFQPSEGDLGGLVMSRLTDVEMASARLRPWAILEKLGRGLVRLHKALGASDNPRFAPRSLTRGQLEGQINRGLGYYANSRKVISQADPPLGELIDLLESRKEGIGRGLENLRKAEGWPAIHIHDDLHLEQVLVSEGEPFFVDFEGEPIRPADERWERNSPLRDLATLLRSLSYVKHTVLRQTLGRRAQRHELRLAAGDASGEALERLNSWEALQRETLLNAYLETLRRTSPEFLPDKKGEVPVLIQAWELEKALYELNYEVLYRPDYVLIPLCALPKEE